MKKTMIAALPILLLSLNSCMKYEVPTANRYDHEMSAGNEFNYNAINNLKIGDTEQKVIATLAGQPCSRTNNDDGTYDLKWQYIRGNISGAYGVGVIIRFSQDGKMMKIVKQGTNKAGIKG